jgi:hypothetical protein
MNLDFRLRIFVYGCAYGIYCNNLIENKLTTVDTEIIKQRVKTILENCNYADLQHVEYYNLADCYVDELLKNTEFSNEHQLVNNNYEQ